MADAKKTAPSAAAAATASGREKVKVAYTIAAGGHRVDLVAFGTNDDRTDFMRERPEEWWRVADITKGEIHTITIPQDNGR